MSQKLSIQIKALFLLLVFSLNTVVGFACALGKDMGFNTSDHNSVATTIKEIYVHANGAKHHHGSVKNKTGAAYHHSYNDNGLVKQKQDGKSITGQNEGGCCSNEVLKFQSLDKNLNQSTSNNSIEAPVFVAMLSTFLGVDLTGIVKEVPAKLKVRFYYPPPPEIRIAIQRFQI